MQNDKHFEFGKNWINYSKKINPKLIKEAEEDLRRLCGDIRGKSFIDIGSGSGIHSLAALNSGVATLLAVDYDKNSVHSTESLIKEHYNIQDMKVSIFEEDILNPTISDKFDVVYSWGVLHHTGDMWMAINLSLIHI